MNLIDNIIRGISIENILIQAINHIYTKGPISITDMEVLSYIAIYHPEIFNKHIDSILTYLAIFYKNPTANTLQDLVFQQYKEHIKDTHHITYTPVQASIASNISNYRCFSFSAPTSTGKSFVFLKEINDSRGDVVVVVPSRALINEYYINICSQIMDKTINVLTFIDSINTSIAKRNIFVVTPERCRELFKQKECFNVDLFLFDEAQLSNEDSKRGLYYDSIIRRCQKAYPEAKFVFAHPFVKNPVSQINKNHFDLTTSNAISYNQKNVGQVYMQIDDNGRFYHFGINREVMGKKRVLCPFDPIYETITKGGTVLFFVSKLKITSKEYIREFEKYINLCEEIDDEIVDEYIERLKQYIGGDVYSNRDYYSQLIAQLKRGIVIHHGSLPLQMRSIIEEYTKRGYCKICFATTTLEQGVNMPFDVVFIDRMDYKHHLAIKNLIGRAGRSTSEYKFDFGYVILNKGANIQKFRNIIINDVELEEVSLLETDDDLGGDYAGFKEAIKNETFSDEYNLTPQEIESLEKPDSEAIVKEILDSTFIDDNLISRKQLDDDEFCHLELYNAFGKLYEAYLHRAITPAEHDVLNTAIKIMLWRVHGKTLRQICAIRYAYASETHKRNKYLQRGWSTDNIQPKYITGYQDLPNPKLNRYSLFYKTPKAQDVDYDIIVCDTYDYIDKLIGFKLSDIYYAAFFKYYEKHNDTRALRLAQYVRYGTDNERHIWMLRYGMSFEDIELLDSHIETIDETKITFKESIYDLDELDLISIKRFIPER